MKWTERIRGIKPILRTVKYGDHSFVFERRQHDSFEDKIIEDHSFAILEMALCKVPISNTLIFGYLRKQMHEN